MESRIEKTEQFFESVEHLFDNQITDRDFQDQLLAVEADMVEALRESVQGGWRSQEEADQIEYDWKQRHGRMEAPE